VLSLAVPFLVLGLVPSLADTQIIPQVADGLGWSTIIVLENKTSTTQTVALSFNMDTTNGAWRPGLCNSSKAFLSPTSASPPVRRFFSTLPELRRR
jgi:hypothetical protein